MKRLFVLLMIAVLLTACQPAAAPVPTTVEEPATMKEQLYGIWYNRGGENFFMEFTSSGLKPMRVWET